MHTDTKQKTSANQVMQAIRKAYRPSLVAGIFCTPLAIAPMFAYSQENDTESADDTEVIEVRGIRQTIQSSISIKRESTEIVDGISAEDIGDLPALSIGEALETLTGASSHREQGGATEISIRGLGPYLGSTVMNGREAANGSGDRSVNFSQFPSELFNKVAIYKTQSAELIEGGVSGQVHLDTIRPLDYGKRRFQLSYKGNVNPDNYNLEDPVNDFGHRITSSFVDQISTDKVGDIGFSIGLQRDTKSNPEQEARTGTSWNACRTSPDFDGGINQSRVDCEDGGGALDLVANENGEAPDSEVPFVFSRSQNSFRQNITDDERESVFGAVQWKPNAKLEVNVDYQYSNREFSEIRNDLVFAEVNHIDGYNVPESERLPFDLEATQSGALRQFTALQNIETNSQYAERAEKYNGGGINIEYAVSDRLKVMFDYAASQTVRTETIIQTRLQSEDRDIYQNNVQGADSNGEVLTASQIFNDGSLVPTWTLQNFDVNYHGAFADEARTRLDLNQSRFNDVSAARIDFDYIPESDFIVGLKGGLRVSKLEYESVPGGSGTNNRTELTFSNDAAAEANVACRNTVFPESDFLDNETGGAPLFTNVDSDGNVLENGTGNSFATFDPICLAENLLSTLTLDDGETRNIENSMPINDEADARDIAAVDMEEETLAAYLQADYDIFLGDYGVRGNFGLRVVKTDVNSVSYRGPLSVERDFDGIITAISPIEGELTQVEGGGSYTKLLPSANLIVDVREDILVRAGIYRGLSRPDPSDLGFGRSFSGLDDEVVTGNLSDAVGRAVAVGNPQLDPFMSWNIDTAVEWYPNEDTVLALGLYFKTFDGGFSNTSQTESFEIDGQDVDTIVTTPQTSDDSSQIYGLELTASHSFSYLDSWLNGFGFKLSYNYADSDFEFEDESFGTSVVINSSTGELEQRYGIVPPANLFGFSEHVLSTQLYYEYESFNAAINYKYRSDYFQQFLSTPGAVRYVDDTEIFEVRLSYRYNSNWKFRIEAINLFDDPKRQYRPARDNFAEINVYGPRVFAGVEFKY